MMFDGVDDDGTTAGVDAGADVDVDVDVDVDDGTAGVVSFMLMMLLARSRVRYTLRVIR